MSQPLIDVNVTLGPWPTRRSAGDDAASLAALLVKHGVEEAWVGSVDGLFFPELAEVNARLAAACAAVSGVRLVPFGELNPSSPTWEADLRRAAEEHRMRGVRLHPNYHGYTLDNPALARALRAATERGLVVSLAAAMEDERMMHPRLIAPTLDLSPLAEVVRQTPGLKLVLLNALKTLRGDALHRLLAAGEVYVDIAMLEGIGGVEKLLADAPAERVLFGSHAPAFYFEAATLKLEESPLSATARRAIVYDNARRLLSEA